ncbi:hypothetical protein [Terricaulis sp.]
MLEPEYSTRHVFPRATQIASLLLSAVVIGVFLAEAARNVI